MTTEERMQGLERQLVALERQLHEVRGEVLVTVLNADGKPDSDYWAKPIWRNSPQLEPKRMVVEREPGQYHAVQDARYGLTQLVGMPAWAIDVLAKLRGPQDAAQCCTVEPPVSRRWASELEARILALESHRHSPDGLVMVPPRRVGLWPVGVD
jgi:hypothetical protein